MVKKLLTFFFRYKWFLLPIIPIIIFYQSLSFPLFKDPTSTVLITQKGELLSARIADDGQWRFPQSDSIPKKFRVSIKYFEDEYFDYHFGVNPISLIRAIKQNISEKKIVSGASTLTMQTIRLSRKGKSRTIFEKIQEIFLAMRLEFSKSKKEILRLYASNAPFGGNVVGLDAAAWRYYKRSADKLSWGEITTLAVLPNSPSLIYPGKNQELLLAKRNRLLEKLHENGEIDEKTCSLSQLEPLPQTPHPLPQITPHLTNRLIKKGYKGQICKVTIKKDIQKKINKIIDDAHKNLKHNEIHNISVLVLDVEKQNVVVYSGNSNCKKEGSGSRVDMITSKRSTGSTLKPLLYTLILDEGSMLPHSIVPDIPTQILSFSPKNFYRTYDGVVPASNALIRSLNIPAVIQLNKYGQKRFYDKLKQLNIQSLNKGARHYGLSLILGGSEITMWELARIYMGMARSLNNYEANGFKYNINNYEDPELIINTEKEKILEEEGFFSAGSIWQSFEILTDLNRPISEGQWESFESSRKIAWKTGTSFGHRDAWAIGITPEYIVVVWAGNADGEGRPGLTGTNIAAPIMFNVFNTMPKTSWFKKPFENMEEVMVCVESGDIASMYCNKKNLTLVPENCKKSIPCSYHHLIHLDSGKKYKVNSSCYEVSNIQDTSWFILNPMATYYYKKVNPFYEIEPELHPDCKKNKQESMQMIYPKNGSKIFLPKKLDRRENHLIFKVAHSKPNSIIYWHLNGFFVGETTGYHNQKIYTSIGNHKLTIVDSDGNEEIVNFEIIGN